jgi:hypothetical protein
MSSWGAGLSWFAGAMLIMIGSFQFLEGLAAVIKDQFFVIGDNYAFELDVTAWGWIHMLWGVLLFLAGWGIFSAATWARWFGIGACVLSAVAQFLYIPYYPIWAVLIIALNIACIWALTTYTREDAKAYS